MSNLNAIGTTDSMNASHPSPSRNIEGLRISTPKSPVKLNRRASFSSPHLYNAPIQNHIQPKASYETRKSSHDNSPQDTHDLSPTTSPNDITSITSNRSLTSTFTNGKAKPSFPPTSPSVFLNPKSKVATRSEILTPPVPGIPLPATYSAMNECTYEDLCACRDAMTMLHVFMTPPKLFLRFNGFREVPDNDPSSSSPPSLSSSKPKLVSKQVLDIKIDLTRFVDVDFLLYNPNGIVQFAHDTTNMFKTLDVYKYIASSQLKVLCGTLQAKYGVCFQKLDVRVTNEEMRERVGGEEGCFGVLYGRPNKKRMSKVAAYCLLPVAFPMYFYEKMHHKSYAMGVVFRMRKKSVAEADVEVKEIMDRVLHELDTNGVVKGTRGQVEMPKSKDMNTVLNRSDQTSTV